MLWTVFLVLMVLWLLGMVSGYALGGFINLLLVGAIVMLVTTVDNRAPINVVSVISASRNRALSRQFEQGVGG